VPILCQLGKLFKTSLYSLFYKGVWERKANFCPRQTGLELSLLWTTRENDANPLVPMFRLVPVFEKLADMDGQPFARWHCYKAHKQSRMARNRKFEPLRCALQITQPSKSEIILERGGTKGRGGKGRRERQEKVRLFVTQARRRRRRRRRLLLLLL